MKINWATLILAIACLVFGVLLMKSCDKVDEVTQRYQDSVRIRTAEAKANKKEADSRKIFSDSVVAKSWADSAQHKHVNDSLKSIISVLHGSLSIAKDSTLKLWGQLRTFYLNGDTTSLRIAYYELRNQLDSTNKMMTDLEFQHERVEYNLRSDADSAHATIRTLYAQLDALKSLLDRQTQIAEASNREEAKILAAQKRKKIWGLIKDIGIGLAGILVGKKL